MNTNELLRKFIDWSNGLEPQTKQIPKSRGNIFLKNHYPEFKKLDLRSVSKNEVSVCPLCNGEGRRIFPNCTPPIDEPCPACNRG